MAQNHHYDGVLGNPSPGSQALLSPRAVQTPPRSPSAATDDCSDGIPRSASLQTNRMPSPENSSYSFISRAPGSAEAAAPPSGANPIGFSPTRSAGLLRVNAKSPPSPPISKRRRQRCQTFGPNLTNPMKGLLDSGSSIDESFASPEPLLRSPPPFRLRPHQSTPPQSADRVVASSSTYYGFHSARAGQTPDHHGSDMLPGASPTAVILAEVLDCLQSAQQHSAKPIDGPAFVQVPGAETFAAGNRLPAAATSTQKNAAVASAPSTPDAEAEVFGSLESALARLELLNVVPGSRRAPPVLSIPLARCTTGHAFYSTDDAEDAFGSDVDAGPDNSSLPLPPTIPPRSFQAIMSIMDHLLRSERRIISLRHELKCSEPGNNGDDAQADEPQGQSASSVVDDDAIGVDSAAPQFQGSAPTATEANQQHGNAEQISDMKQPPAGIPDALGFEAVIGSDDVKDALMENVVLPLTLASNARGDSMSSLFTGLRRCGHVLLHGPPGLPFCFFLPP